MIMSQSVTHKDYPPQEEYVRSYLFISGYMIRPVDKNMSSVVYVQIGRFWRESGVESVFSAVESDSKDV